MSCVRTARTALFAVISAATFSSSALTPAHATVFAQRAFDEVIEETPVIVRGRVEKSAPAWSTTKKGEKRIYTYTEVTVTDVVKGEVKTQTLKFREVGGEVDGVGLDIVGAAKFKDGEDVVLMLNPGNAPGDATFNLRGLMMGKLMVVKNADGDEVLKGPALSGETPWSMDRLRETARSGPKARTDATGVMPSPTATPVSLIYAHDEKDGHSAEEHTESAPSEASASFMDTRRGKIILYGLLAAFIVVRTLRKRGRNLKKN